MPYASAEQLTRTGGLMPISRRASKSATVPPTLTRKASTGSSPASGANAIPARCTTASGGPAGSSIQRTRPDRSAMSSTSGPGAATTLCPWPTSSFSSQQPTKPIAPVTKTLIECQAWLVGSATSRCGTECPLRCSMSAFTIIRTSSSNWTVGSHPSSSRALAELPSR